MTTDRLTAAIWTPPGRGAVATVRVCGDLRSLAARTSTCWRAANGRSLSELPAGQMCFGRWGRDTSEDVVVCRWDDWTCEVHGHGGSSAVRRIVEDLIDCGCAETDWQAQGRSDFLDPEFSGVLSRAVTLRAAGWIVNQAGRMSRELARLEQLCVVDPVAAQRDVDRHLSWSSFGRHLTRLWSVVVVGRPNVGKSSLINALVGYERSIVFDQPGTTRDIVTAETVWDGWAFRLSDTAGDRDSTDVLEATGIARARAELSAADLTLLVLDMSEPPQPDDLRLLSERPEALLVAHKLDLPNQWGQLRPSHAMAVSSREKTGLSELAEAIVRRLVPNLPAADAVVPLTERQVEALRNLR